MEIAKLILEFTKVLAWPLVVICIMIYFRSEIVAIFPRLKEAKVGGVSISFEAEIAQAKQLSKVVESSPATDQKAVGAESKVELSEANAKLIGLGMAPSPSGLDLDYYRDVAKRDPNLALAGIRIELEIAARNLAKGFSVRFDAKDSVSWLFSRLQSAGAVGPDQAELTRRILNLCNRAVHGQPTSKSQANEVIAIAGVLINDYISWLSWGFKSSPEFKDAA